MVADEQQTGDGGQGQGVDQQPGQRAAGPQPGTRARAASRKVKASALTPSSTAGRSAAQRNGTAIWAVSIGTRAATAATASPNIDAVSRRPSIGNHGGAGLIWDWAKVPARISSTRSATITRPAYCRNQ
ncbi:MULTISPECIES: hypothetical protein [unclassified Nonomuraea]|uniref:hypothetical protein n=1 Tax=unclassified Nonomuraea TaxID=2593643 RepID=UPI0033EC51CF